MTNLITEKLRLLKETRDYYIVNPLERRCSDEEGNCVYSPESAFKPNSDGCAIGRLIPRDLAIEFDKLSSASVSVFMEEIPSSLSKFGNEFLIHLQGFHDVGDYWDREGLTDKGIGCYNSLRELVLDETI